MTDPTLNPKISVGEQVIDHIYGKTVNLAGSATRNSSKKPFLLYLKDLAIRLFKYLTNPKSWQKSPKLWIIAFLFLRCFYSFLKEYGWMGSKKFDGDHVFLTGAGNGIGRLMAIRFGKLGCYLSLSDINMQGLE